MLITVVCLLYIKLIGVLGMNPNEEQIKQVKNIVVKNLDMDTIGEIISIKNIEEGEKSLNNFSEIMKFGTPVTRPGRIAFDIIKDKAPHYLKLLKETSGLDDINDGVFDEYLLDENKFKEIVNEMKEEDEIEEAQDYTEARKELLQLINMGLKVDRNLTWDVRKIMRNENLIFYLERDGNDIDFLKELYKYIPEKKMKRIRKAWNAQFED